MIEKEARAELGRLLLGGIKLKSFTLVTVVCGHDKRLARVLRLRDEFWLEFEFQADSLSDSSSVQMQVEAHNDWNYAKIAAREGVDGEVLLHRVRVQSLWPVGASVTPRRASPIAVNACCATELDLKALATELGSDPTPRRIVVR